MNQSLFKKIFVGAAVLLGVGVSAFADPLLKPGYAVHTFGVSPDAARGDGNATVRIYKITGHDYNSSRPTADFSNTITNSDWTIDKIGNVYGITIDKDRNIYVTASANWSPGYVGTGDSGNDNVPVKYGSIEHGSDDNNSAGRVYKIDSDSGSATVLATLPQKAITVTNQVCQGAGQDVVRNNSGAGLGNIVYDKFHDQFFVSNFSDGKIYRLDKDGKQKGKPLDLTGRGLTGIDSNNKAVRAPYGLTLSLDGKKLYFGTIEMNYYPQLYSVTLETNGDFGSTQDEGVKLVDDIPYTQNIGGDATNTGVWAAYSDMTFTPDGELLIGVRVGCESNFATSYNHGGIVYLLKKGSNGWEASDKTNPDLTNPGEDKETTYSGDPINNNDQDTRAGHYGTANDDYYKYDRGAIPLHPHEGSRLEQAELQYGPDDGYGGVAIWQDENGKIDYFATSADITTKEGVHGFMQFSSDFKITSRAVVDKAIGYKAVKSSTSNVTTNANPYDYKGIGGDVEVLSVMTMCIGSYVWEDKDKDGQQNEGGTSGLKNVNVTLKDANGHEINTTKTDNEGVYEFCGLPEGKYRVCLDKVIKYPSDNNKIAYIPTSPQTTANDNDSEADSNMGSNGCSGVFGLWANTEPEESGTHKGDDQDDGAEKMGNMTVDIGFIKKFFDLALIKVVDSNKTKFDLNETVDFNITVINQGNLNAKNVIIKDIVPAGLILDDSDWNDVNDTNETTYKTPLNIEANRSKTIQITFRIDPNFKGQHIVNVAEIEHAENDLNLTDKDSIPGEDDICLQHNKDLDNDNDVNDTKGCDDLDPAKITVDQHFDLSLVKRVKAGDEKKKNDENVTFVITVTNEGKLDAKNVDIYDYLPKELVLADDETKWEKVGNDEHIVHLVDPIETIKAKKSVSVEIKCTIHVGKNFTGQLINFAEIASAETPAGDKAIDGDSVPGSEKGKTHNIDDVTTGGDDYDPAIIDIVPCDCYNVSTNSTDAMSMLGLILMLIGTGMIGIWLLRQEEKRSA